MTSCFVHYDAIYYLLPVNSKYLKMWGVDSPILGQFLHMEKLAYFVTVFCVVLPIVKQSYIKYDQKLIMSFWYDLQGLEGYFRDSGFDQNTVRESGKR